MHRLYLVRSVTPTPRPSEKRSAKVIELRYFGGLSVEETADALGVSPQTVLRDWKLARAIVNQDAPPET